jgi:hypothetical protein
MVAYPEELYNIGQKQRSDRDRAAWQEEVARRATGALEAVSPAPNEKRPRHPPK